MPITKGSRQLVEEASAQITTYTVEQVRARSLSSTTPSPLPGRQPGKWQYAILAT